jgi:hypothetical protein
MYFLISMGNFPVELQIYSLKKLVGLSLILSEAEKGRFILFDLEVLKPP